MICQIEGGMNLPGARMQKLYAKFSSRKREFAVLGLALVLVTCLKYHAAETWQHFFLIIYALLVCAAGAQGALRPGLAFLGLSWLFCSGVPFGFQSLPALDIALQGVFLAVCFILGLRHNQIRKLETRYRSLWTEYSQMLQHFESSRDEVNRLYCMAANFLAATLEARDEEALRHMEQVAAYAVALARNMGLSPKELTDIYYASMLHDLGKIGISELILNKPGKLTGEEYAQVRRHPEIGIEILQTMTFMKNLFPLILHHHEYYDGTGYPGGLARDQIPLGARIIAIADAYDAMTSDRPYRPAFSQAEAVVELKRGAGTQFDPHLVERFLEILKHGQLKELRGDFSPPQIPLSGFYPVLH